MESIVCVCVEGFPQWNQFSQIVKPHVVKPYILLTGRLEKCVCVCLEKCVCVCVCPCFYKEHLGKSQVEIKINRNGNQPSQDVSASPTNGPIT